LEVDEAILLFGHEQSSGEILEAALIEPVMLTTRGKEMLVIMTVDQYRKLLGHSHTAAYGLADAPDKVHDELMPVLDHPLEDGHV